MHSMSAHTRLLAIALFIAASAAVLVGCDRASQLIGLLNDGDCVVLTETDPNNPASWEHEVVSCDSEPELASNQYAYRVNSSVAPGEKCDIGVEYTLVGTATYCLVSFDGSTKDFEAYAVGDCLVLTSEEPDSATNRVTARWVDCGIEPQLGPNDEAFQVHEAIDDSATCDIGVQFTQNDSGTYCLVDFDGSTKDYEAYVAGDCIIVTTVDTGGVPDETRWFDCATADQQKPTANDALWKVAAVSEWPSGDCTETQTKLSDIEHQAIYCLQPLT